MNQKKVAFLFSILLLLLASCNKPLPLQMPDLGISNKILDFNRYIKLTVPPQLNTYKPGESISLEIQNFSEHEWNFNITKDILIYQYENQEWKKVTDGMINIGPTEVILGPGGKFPLDKQLVGVLPNVKMNQPINLRIILILHGQNPEKDPRLCGAYVDVLLRP